MGSLLAESQRGALMTRIISLLVRFVLICAGGYVLLASGEYAATGYRPAGAEVQAFIALIGLGLMLRLFSVAPVRARLRW
jgi:hypothetical protein